MVPEDDEHPSGFKDGTILETPVHAGVPNAPIEIVRERIVHGPDNTWHKEVVE
jgi:hypothetical protein